MKQVDLSLLPEYLQSRRWFAGKAWPIKAVSVLEHATVEAKGSTPFTLAVIEVRYELGTPERYLLPVTVDDRGRTSEAMDDDVLARALLDLIRGNAELTAAGGVLRGQKEPLSQGQWAQLPGEPGVRRLSVEQSNTSMVFHESIILKLVRKLEDGLNPELEIGRFLSERHFPGAPALLGSLSFHGAAESTIAVAHRFVRAEADGWKQVVEAFRSAHGASREFLTSLRLLGMRVADLHMTLASAPDDPAFAPEPVHTEDLQRWSASIIGQLGVAIADAAQHLPGLADRRAALTARARALAHLPASGQKLRVHGDLHLGQVLWTGQDWSIFDFEGEPVRSYSQRREKQSPLKDVAGMLRSFAYAEASLELEGHPAPGRAAAARTAFLEGYRATAGKEPFLPGDDKTFQGLLDALELEKLLYELRYELSHRPDWVKIPARILLERGTP